MLLAESSVIERSNDGLTCTGGSDDEVAVSIVEDTFGVELLKQFGLIRLGGHFQSGQADGERIAIPLAGCDFEGSTQPVTVLG